MSQNANLILNRLRTLIHVSNDVELSQILNVKPNTIATWRKRDTLNYKTIIALCEHRKIDLNLVFFDEKSAISVSKNERGLNDLPLKEYIQNCVSLAIEEMRSDVINLSEKTDSIFEILDKNDVANLLEEAKKRIGKEKKLSRG